MNRLARERSPYLLQHATNPVDWYPWGDEAFARARDEGRPIFLSIGYSTCHWCHVMEHESFMDADVAAVLNEHFVSVKVDREERPDVDRVYMAFVQATTGAGGWPMSVWLTPELKPFYGGTYYPRESKWGRPGFLDLLKEIARVWRVDQAKLRASADDVTVRLAAHELVVPVERVPSAAALEKTTAQFLNTFDAQHGGFGQAPKFPRPSELLFLLREHARTGKPEPRQVALQTLQAMAIGGVRDHVGGGFHRYSVDRAWRVPHFEKMLYDQAQLAIAYVEAAQVSGDAFFREVAEDTLQYVMREMTGEGGGFLSAEDADSVPYEHAHDATPTPTEGAFYTWQDDEILRLFGPDADVVRTYFGIEPGGNAPFDPHDEFAGRNILFVGRGLEAIASDTGRTPASVMAILQRARQTLFEARSQRPRPHRDDKVLTGWNGLTIAAFARLARLLRGSGAAGEVAAEIYLQTAREAATFIRRTLWLEDTHRLLRRYRDGQAEIDAYAEDYAGLIFGLLDLFAADPDPAWLQWAMTLQDQQDALFWDDENGGWFSTTGHDPTILLRLKETYDGAEPTASSLSAHNLLVLSQLVDRPAWQERLERTLRFFGPALEQQGRAVPMMGAVLSVYHAGPAHVVVVHSHAGAAAGAGNANGGDDDLARSLAMHYLPHAITVTVNETQQQAVAAVLPLVRNMTPVDGSATAYVCRNFACLPAITSTEALLAELAPVG